MIAVAGAIIAAIDELPAAGSPLGFLAGN